jgi:uncharacterized protein YegL
MKKNYTKIIFVIDRSGSMTNIKNDMEGGLKNFISEQIKLNVGKCDVSLYQFDDVYESVFENKDITNTPEYTLNPRNATALYDAIGNTINRVGNQLSQLKEEDRPDRVMMVIITDGMENSSKEYNAAKIKEMITHQSETYNWQFSYLGSNQDAWAVSQDLGICNDSTMTYANNSIGVDSVWASLSTATTMYRSCTNAVSAKLVYTNADLKAQEEAFKV